MEYFRDDKDQIYSDFAYRLGQIIEQYDKIKNEEKFESTLYIVVLQSLLTIFNEKAKIKRKRELNNSIFNKSLSDLNWGIEESCWINNSYVGENSLLNLLFHIRNALSHPTLIFNNVEIKSTGYTTIKDGGGIIKKYRFIDSPDVNSNNHKRQYNKNQIQNIIFGVGVDNTQIKYGLPSDISFKLVDGETNKYYLISDGEAYIRISIIELTTYQLGLLVKNLAVFIAQFLHKNWDGSIKELIET